jgi:hypothetical protein
MRSESLRTAYGGGGVAWRDGWTRAVRDRTRAFKCDTPLRAADHGRHISRKSVTLTPMTRVQSRRSRDFCDEVGRMELEGAQGLWLCKAPSSVIGSLASTTAGSVHRKMASFRQQSNVC